MSATFQRSALLYLFQLKTSVCIESYLSDLQESPKGSRSPVNNPLINKRVCIVFKHFLRKYYFFHQLKNEGLASDSDQSIHVGSPCFEH
jgi:hypothetical protein